MTNNIVAEASDPYELFIAELRRIEPTIGHDEYTEIHHITPRHDGGTNDSSNLVRCRYEDHVEAHRVRWETYRQIGDGTAYKMMSSRGPTGNVTLKSCVSKAIQAKRKAEGTHNWSKEWQAKIQAKLKAEGKTVYNPEWQAELQRQQRLNGHPFHTKEGQAAIHARLKAEKKGAHDPKYQRWIQKVGTKAATVANTLSETSRLLTHDLMFSFYESEFTKNGHRKRTTRGKLVKSFVIKKGATLPQIDRKVAANFGVTLSCGIAGKLVRGDSRSYKGVFCDVIEQLELISAQKADERVL